LGEAENRQKIASNIMAKFKWLEDGWQKAGIGWQKTVGRLTEGW
jgi:hypothetical protein